MTYSQLEQHFLQIGHLQEVEAILEWDRVVNMPDAAAEGRGQSMALLSVLRHERLCDGHLPEWFAQAERGPLDSWQQANLTEMIRLWRRHTAVSSELVGAITEACARCEQAWRSARQANDFEQLKPLLSRVVELKRREAEILARALDVSPYEALMDEFEPGARTDEIDALFAPLAEFLPTFTQEVLDGQPQLTDLPCGPYPIEAQRALGVQVMNQLGFDPSRGRLDVSHHPFCGGVPSDVRITTRYTDVDFTSSLMGVLHEAGHAKYEQGLPPAYRYQPVGAARGMILHESQSLLQEMQVCRSPEFLSYAAPLIRAAFPEQVARNPGAFYAENLAAQARRVCRSLIRVDADEVTYPAHVLLRYEIEKGLIDGSVLVRDIPELWNERMLAFLGVSTLGDDKNGCMQDVHWPSGAFGYFPLYTLGAMAAAQLFEAASRGLPGLQEQISRGDVSSLDAWLAENVWGVASSRSTQRILSSATGRGLATDAFITHLRRRYGVN